ncbi:MAG: hypothetical protein CVV25_09520 [Ignavibacteriae bacterium HGW-Ignavibacteriae-4]|nr:MAG: hypothetical protein CVV25_09520 [Ignavibacteriae bacterium HGW-Ignavibacteriae-4]
MKIFIKIGLYLLYINSLTWRVRVLGSIDHNPKVIAFWHGKMLPVWFYFRKYKKKAGIVSKSKDGQVLTDYLKILNFDLIRGSSSKGGKQVIERAIKQAKDTTILITPDGPRGPKEKMKIGAILISHKGNVPLQLCTVDIGWSIKLNSWDKFEIPLPFSPITLKFSEIFDFESLENREEVTRELIALEKILSDIS